MALDQQVMYIQKAHRLSLYNVSANVNEVHEGQHFHLDANGEWTYADGSKKSYPTLNARFAGQGMGPQGERLEGRDDVSRAGKLACIKGNFEIGTDQYDDAVTYTHGAPLIVSADPTKAGKVTLFDPAAAGAKPHLIVGFVTQVPAEPGDFLRYEG